MIKLFSVKVRQGVAFCLHDQCLPVCLFVTGKAEEGCCSGQGHQAERWRIATAKRSRRLRCDNCVL